MAVNDYEQSTERGQPVELYKFIFGANVGNEYRYTNAETDITFDGDVYTALPTERDQIATKGRGDSREISIEVPKSSAVSELFRIFPPGRVVNVIIYQGHIPNPDDPLDWSADTNFGVIWTGRVLEASRKNNTTVLSCENSEAGMKRVGLRRHYQWACPLVLYGARCKADKAAATRAATVAAISGNSVTLDPGWEGGNTARDFLGGLFEWDSSLGREYRTIIGASGDTLKLNATTSELAVSDAVDVILGCPHTLAGCRDIHDNAVNYGGQPWIPLKNPVGKNNHT